MFGTRHAPERLPAARAQHARGFFLAAALRLHERNQFARDERKRDKNGRQHNARHGENDFEIVLVQPVCQPGKLRMVRVQVKSQPALRAENQDVNQAGNHRRNGERQVNQREQNIFAAKIKFRNRPGRADAENAVQRHGDGGGGERELDGAPGVRVAQGCKIKADALGKRLREHKHQRKEKKQAQKHQRDADEQRGARAAVRSSCGDARPDAACERWSRRASCEVAGVVTVRPPLQHVDAEQQPKRDDEHHDGDGGGFRDNQTCPVPA